MLNLYNDKVQDIQIKSCMITFVYDDPVHNKVMSPLGGPASSYRFDIMDIGSMDQPEQYWAFAA